MKNVTTIENLNVPSYAASYLVNGDTSDITADDRIAIDKWLAPFELRAAASSVVARN